MTLQDMRKKKNYTVKELGTISGVNYRSLQNLESGFRNINTANLDTLCRLAIALDCTLFDILTDEELKIKLKLALKLQGLTCTKKGG